MDEQRIARIIELEGNATKPERIASEVRWETARLYWEEYQSGTSQAAIAEKVGKSRPHVTYMVKCWDITGRHMADDLASFPDFQTIYRSPEVRGQSADISDSPSRDSGRERRQRKPDTVHEWVEKFGYLAERIAEYPDGMTMSERKTLRHAIRSIERVIAEHTRAA
jgi:hypothetical protein